MKVYVGQTRGRQWIALMESHGFGEMVVRGEMPPRRKPWAFDNGGYRDWTAGRGFNWKVLSLLETIWRYDGNPDFIVVPDMVAGGNESFEFSKHWVDKPEVYRPRFRSTLRCRTAWGTPARRSWTGLRTASFLSGGSLQWKVATGQSWVELAHRHGEALSHRTGWHGEPCRLGSAHRGRLH